MGSLPSKGKQNTSCIVVTHLHETILSGPGPDVEYGGLVLKCHVHRQRRANQRHTMAVLFSQISVQKRLISDVYLEI